MLDTVILKLYTGSYKITNAYRFEPNANLLLKNMGFYLVPCFNNPTKEEKESDFNYPRLTLTKRPTKRLSTIELKIEFSATKILFNNNVNELEESDFDAVIMALKKRLSEMGVEVEAEILKNGSVSAIHPAKNIPLEDGYTSSFVIRELGKIGLTRKLDMDKGHFRNEGQSLQLYAISSSFVIYDKIKDLAKTKGRATDKNQTSGQLTLFKQIKDNEPNLELLRLEVRLSKKVKMNSILAELGYAKNPSFADIFKKELWQKIIDNYWQNTIKNHSFLFDVSSDPQKLLQRMIKKYPSIKPKQAVYLIGLNILCKDRGGIRELRVLLEQQATGRTWSRSAQDIKILNSIQPYDNHIEWINQINSNIKTFNSYKTHYYDKKSEVSTRGPSAYREDV